MVIRWQVMLKVPKDWKLNVTEMPERSQERCWDGKNWRGEIEIILRAAILISSYENSQTDLGNIFKKKTIGYHNISPKPVPV